MENEQTIQKSDKEKDDKNEKLKKKKQYTKKERFIQIVCNLLSYIAFFWGGYVLISSNQNTVNTVKYWFSDFKTFEFINYCGIETFDKQDLSFLKSRCDWRYNDYIYSIGGINSYLKDN